MSVERRVETLLGWLRSSDQFYLSPNVEVNECEESGRGVVLKFGALKKNEKVVSIPGRYQLNFNTILWNISLFNPQLEVSGVTMSDGDKQLFQSDDKDPRFKIYSSLDQKTLMSLTSFQLFALYILVEWTLLPLLSKGSIKSFWQPFFDAWPSKEELRSIPAIWYNSPLSMDKELLEYLPLSSKELLKKKNDLLKQDWNVIQAWLLNNVEQFRQDGYECPSPEDLYDNFLHVYFIINSRCLYSKVHLKKDDIESQFTMVPFVDFLNHTEEIDSHCYPKITRNPRASLEVGAFSLRCGDHSYNTVGEPVLLNYGPHSNDFLLNEYGFVLQTNRWNYIDISDEIISLVGEDNAMESFLKKHGYWGNYTINESEVSYRVLVALSLIVTKDYKRVEKLLLGVISEDYFLPKISSKLRELLESLFENYQNVMELLRKKPTEADSFSVGNLATIYDGYMDIIEHHLNRIL